MQRLLPYLTYIKRTLLVSAVLMYSLCSPLAVFADDPAPVCTPPTSGVGVIRPVGADAATYTYNCDTGLWENSHFTYNPSTGLATAKDPVIYTYNSTSGAYDYTLWGYSAPTGSYVPYTQSVAQPPAGANVVGGPPATSSITNTGPGSDNTIDNTGGTTGTNSINNTGPGSSNAIGGTASGDLNVNNGTVASFNNLLTAQAGTGNAMVLGNTTGGSAASGNAQDMATIVNMLQSASSALGSTTATFVANINGDVNGDLLIDPAALSAIQPTTTPSGSNNITFNNQLDASINNNITLDAASGDATVASNTNGGNATSGSAEAIANVVNLINSAISSGKSFVGVVNINGNLNGDILMPPNLLDQLIGSNVPTVNISTIGNTGPNSNNSINNNNSSNNTTVNNTNNLGINNNINASAASGQAGVTNNTSAGNATSGSAGTNITAFNLTGSNLIGANDLLVFVNVLGQWVGMIVNAPAGATAAELGGGITQNSQNGNNTTAINNTANQQINNNINASAKSGNASVTDNTKAGNATSGNAKTAVNLLNVQNSSLSLANWFGILFINVFGTWHGSFGINTSAGDPPYNPSTGSGSGGTPSPVMAFTFVPTGTTSGHGKSSGNYRIAAYGTGTGSSDSSDTTGTGGGMVLAAKHIKTPPGSQSQGINYGRIARNSAIIMGVTSLFLASDLLYARRHTQKAT